MGRDAIPACYFPTRVVLVDDNRHFLNSINIELLYARRATPLLYDSPLQALRFLNDEYRPSRFTDRCLNNQEETPIDHRVIDIDLSAIRQEIYNLQRFREISIVIADYSMPDLNGLELCAQIEDRWIKKILLTGEADEGLAVQAFNKGIIHKFIRKGTKNFTETINTAIQELQHQYFRDLSRIIIDNLARNTTPNLSCLDDPVFIKLFNKICQENEVTEYYLADECGSFMFLDFEGKPSWLAVKNEDAMEAAFQIADYSDSTFPPAILQAMKNREKILYIHEEGYSSDPVECAKFLFPAKQLVGRQTYYYALIKDPKTYDIKPSKVFSYKASLMAG